MADSEKGEGGSRTFVIDGGFVRMADDVLTILAERATAAESISQELGCGSVDRRAFASASDAAPLGAVGGCA
jgi:F0F1-type ATP synthase epsilon subunit